MIRELTCLPHREGTGYVSIVVLKIKRRYSLAMLETVLCKVRGYHYSG